MSLPTDLEIKSYLRISTDVEDILIFGLNQTAQAQVAQYLRTPLGSEARTFKGRRPRQGYRRELAEQLWVPVQPCDETATITDLDDVEVDAATYTIDGATGYINAIQGESFDNPPYTIAINVGLIYDPNYDADVDPILRQAILDLASDLWNSRNPRALYEQSGGQVSITYDKVPMARRTTALLDSLRTPWHAW
jgi:hypothetical protein